MKDYRVTVKIRNNRIIKAIEESGGVLGGKWCDANGLEYGAINRFVNLTLSPLDCDGNLRVQARKLCDVLGFLPDELWSKEQVRPLERNFTELEMSHEQINAMLPDGGSYTMNFLEVEDRAKHLNLVLDTIDQREREVLEMRNGMNGRQELTLDEIARAMGVSPERVRQIEARALRKCRHPKNTRFIYDYRENAE